MLGLKFAPNRFLSPIPPPIRPPRVLPPSVVNHPSDAKKCRVYAERKRNKMGEEEFLKH